MSSHDSHGGKPCKCHEQAGADADFGDLGDGIPEMSELEAALSGLSSADGAGELSLDLAALDDALSGGDALEFENLGANEGPTLESLVALAERYPGLKVSISF